MGLVYLFYRFFFKTLKNNFYYTDEQYHIRMIDYEFVFFKKGIFNMETKEKIIKLKEKDFNDELNEETDFRDEYIMNDDEVTILEREEEENLPFVESGFFRNFSLCQPKREIAISKWSQIKGPLKNIYNYKPILFNVLDGISRNEIIPTNTCYSNVIYLL